MQVVACGETRGAALAEDFLLLYHLARFDVDFTHVSIEGDQSGAVVDQNRVAIDTEVFGNDDLAVISRFDRVVLDHRKIESDMILLIHGFPLINVSPPIRKIRFHLGIAQLKKRAVPEKLTSRVLRQLRDSFVDTAAQVAVDFDEVLDRISLILDGGRVRHDFRYDLLHQAVFERNFSGAEFLRENLVPELGGRLIACRISGDYLYRRVGGQVVFEREQREVKVLVELVPWEELLPDLNS